MNGNLESNSVTANILVVDDKPDNLRLLSALLGDRGYKVRRAINGQLALNAAFAEPPDLILLDIMMPEMNGYEVCQQLKSDPRTNPVPVIFLSALDDAFDKVKAFEVGGVDYITKPFQFPEVLARVENHLNLRQLQQQTEEQKEQLESLNRDLEAKVEARTAELKRKNAALLQLEVQLRDALAQEKELSDMKTRIITTISHEYRTPLTTIASSAELLEAYRHKWDEQKQLKHFNRIQSAIKHMTNLVEEVLFINRAESEKLDFYPVDLNLEKFCSEIVEEIQQPNREKYQVKFMPDAGEVNAQFDAKLLRQILTNLLSNAIKYSPEGGVVELHLSRDPEQVVFQVRDEGIGIPPEDQEKLFQSFSRASNVATIQGTGLGLSIVQKCVELHGGKISVDSQLGVGTTFTVCLPVS
ncbi:hybrid sensor histidine kinase/response regulator [Phormidium sp. CCY1219]|uniref:hybrid sensor histidine kinase/response regulator n=1 Tax=Phormidium sp. CCY1219 TaxID=2886104 RepID=UPI002D1EC161|nr:hybrid sensor histidine kinase/response regulator [Phormidium sp. CCY1219]MEB3829077.1 hybrid sensor histidine kinase/response regulator [Phormidium sp. CCY1219]